MFDLGFTEIVLIAVVALVVLGPERMPRVARTVGRFIARGQGYVAQIKDEFEREAEVKEIKDLRDEFAGTGAELENDIRQSTREIENALRVEDKDPYTTFNRSEAFISEPVREDVSSPEVARVRAARLTSETNTFKHAKTPQAKRFSKKTKSAYRASAVKGYRWLTRT
ncbi:MAG TPA: twin-arginine translocase subunit TatB [Sutterella sp.]|nr:twin-arginine translocase subunit TatB [Sutterella sp.]